MTNVVPEIRGVTYTLTVNKADAKTFVTRWNQSALSSFSGVHLSQNAVSETEKEIVIRVANSNFVIGLIEKDFFGPDSPWKPKVN